MNFLLKSSICLAAALAAAQPVFAQDAADPIGALLDQSPAMDEDEAEQPGPPPQPAPPIVPQARPITPPPVYSPPPAPTPPAPYPYSPPATASYPPRGPVPYTPGPLPYTPRPVAPYNPPPSSYAAPTYARPAPPKLNAPVHVDEYDKTPEAPLNPTELGYETRLRSSFASAQGLQGPLDGAWTLSTNGGQPLYTLLFVDKGRGQLEGAWRDPRRRGATDSSGFLAGVQRMGSQLSASFQPRPGAPATTITLNPASGGAWTGELYEDGTRTAVTLKRD